MKVTNATNTSINSPVSKIIETGNGFLINTQYYDKEYLSPIPLESIAVNNTDSYVINTNKRLFLYENQWFFDFEDRFGIIKDSNINLYPNRYYVYIRGWYYHPNIGNDRHARILIFDENENGQITWLYDTHLHRDENYTYMQITDYLGQDDEFIYFTSKREESYDTGYTYNQIWHIRKSNFELGRVAQYYSTFSNPVIMKTCETPNTVYMNMYSENNVYNIAYEKTTHSHWISGAIRRDTASGSTFNSYRYTNIPDDSYKIDDTHYGTFVYNADNTQQPLDIYIIDTSTNSFTSEHCNIIWNGIITEIPFVNNNTKRIIYRNFISEFDGVKYLNVYVYQKDYNAGNYIAIQGLYTFMIIDKNTLQFVARNQIDAAQQIGGFIYDDSKEHLIIAKREAFQILKFNRLTKNYELTLDEVTNCDVVGLDELSRIWYAKTDTSIHMVNLEDAQSVNIEYEKPYYEYTGSSISTYINFSATNYLSNPFSGKFKLTINGPAVFSENNSNILIFNYDGSGNQQIGITITGAAPITIYPYFIN